MPETFKDSSHLIRLALLFAAGGLAFLLFRALLVPADFGELGHFRTGALTDMASRPLHFAGRQACAECHADQAKKKAAGKHVRLGCESCHGALAAHAADPKVAKAEKPDAVPLCVRCHTANQAKPAKFPQVVPASHNEGAACNDCHDPHSPGMG